MPSITLNAPISPIGWRETLIGGQCFRWRADTESDSYLGQIEGKGLSLKLDCGRIHWDNTEVSAQTLRHYLAIDTEYTAAIDVLPWRSDDQLKEAMDAFGGLRILRQPVEETLFCFLCSSVKSIPQIQEMLESVCRDYGQALSHGQHTFPGWDALQTIGEAPLRALKLGYRAKYIAQTAQLVSEDFFTELKTVDYPRAKQMLVSLPGVGEKIADCVCLFGLGHLEAFPVDTWIIQVMSELYGLEGWSPTQIAHFGRSHFGQYAGLAQQFLFSWVRSRK